MTKLYHDEQHEYFLDYFKGIPVKIIRNRKTGEIHFDANSVAKCLGFEDTQAMMSQDEVLDLINRHIKETGESPPETTLSHRLLKF